MENKLACFHIVIFTGSLIFEVKVENWHFRVLHSGKLGLTLTLLDNPKKLSMAKRFSLFCLSVVDEKSFIIKLSTDDGCLTSNDQQQRFDR